MCDNESAKLGFIGDVVAVAIAVGLAIYLLDMGFNYLEI